MNENISMIAMKIRALYPKLTYDHKIHLDFSKEIHPHVIKMQQAEEFRIGYACLKYAVAKILEPKKIIEIGVRTGISAMAFLSAVPDAHFLGIDSELDSKADNIDYLSVAKKAFEKENLDTSIVVADSADIYDLPFTPDLVHIDGNHSRGGAGHDTRLALSSGAPWILVDDGEEESVAAGVLDGLCSCSWDKHISIVRFDECWGDSILIQSRSNK